MRNGLNGNEPNGKVVASAFSLPFQTSLDRQDRVLTTERRTYND